MLAGRALGFVAAPKSLSLEQVQWVVPLLLLLLLLLSIHQLPLVLLLLQLLLLLFAVANAIVVIIAIAIGSQRVGYIHTPPTKWENVP